MVSYDVLPLVLYVCASFFLLYLVSPLLRNRCLSKALKAYADSSRLSISDE